VIVHGLDGNEEAYECRCYYDDTVKNGKKSQSDVLKL